jgi:hypothetical protein
MTRTDLMALLKVQLAGAGLDPFWPPVEHALLAPETPSQLELPASVSADWDPTTRRWSLEFTPFHEAGCDGDAYALWLRSFRQTTAMLDAHLVDWRVRAGETGRTEPGSWLAWPLAADRASRRVWEIRRDPVGLVGYSAVMDGCRHAFYPLSANAAGQLADRLRESGGTGFATSRDLGWLRPPRSADSAQ